MSERSGVLTGEQIKQYGLIEVEDERLKDDTCYQACSYDLRLGNEHYVSDEDGKWKLICLSSDSDSFLKFDRLNKEIDQSSLFAEAELLHFQRSEPSGTLIIPPFGTAIIELMERVNTNSPFHIDKTSSMPLTPQVIVGRFDLKLSVIYKGLFSQQATQVEPGYHGHLYCFITSQSSKPVKLSLGEKIATIEFSFADCAYLGSVMEQAQAKAKKKESPYYVNGGIIDIRAFYDSISTLEVCGLTPIYKKVTTEYAAAIDSHLNKTETIDMISKCVERNLNTKNSLIKTIFSFFEAAVVAFGGSYLSRIGAALEEISKDLDDYIPVLQNDTSDLMDVTKYSDKCEELLSNSTFFIVAACILFAFFTVSGIIYLMKAFWPLWMNRYEAKRSFRQYRDENSMPKSALRRKIDNRKRKSRF